MFEIIIAFGAGLVSFLSPCVLPLIPGYISYISGSSLSELVSKKNINLFPIILFTVGFSIVFIIFGAASTFLGQVLLKNSYELRITAGLETQAPILNLESNFGKAEISVFLIFSIVSKFNVSGFKSSIIDDKSR